jgi:anti-anti-sigma factor
MARRKSKSTADSLPRLAIEGELTIYTAADSKPKLLGALRAPATEFDLSQVTEIDSAGLQLLLLAKREARAAGIELHFTGHSSAVIDCFDLCDLGAVFGDPIVLAGSGT